MARTGYERLPGSQETPYASVDDEMERAFESDAEEGEDAPIAEQSAQPTPTVRLPGQVQEGEYDFEREYDRPPPGSPPTSATAVPGNSNGVLPSPSSVFKPVPSGQQTRPSFLRRAVGALLPQHYARVPDHDGQPMVSMGSGLENDGVFSNVTARPAPPRTVQDEHGDVHVMPEDVQSEAPPSYAAAQADAAPPYWETTVHAPLGGSDDLLIDGLPAGSILSFAFNFLISVSFQFVGFMLTYLLHTSHAAKYGSRAGLGVTLIQYGLFSQAINDELGTSDGTSDGEVGTTVISSGKRIRLARRGYESLSPRIWSTSPEGSDDDAVYLPKGSMHDWLSFLLMTIGWILVLSSLLGFVRVKRWERILPSINAPESVTPEVIRRDAEIRSRLADAFGI